MTPTQIERGRRWLFELLDLLPDLRVLIALGKKAQKSVVGAGGELTGRQIAVIEAPHPSPIQAGVTRGRSLEQINQAFHDARLLAAEGGGRA